MNWLQYQISIRRFTIITAPYVFVALPVFDPILLSPWPPVNFEATLHVDNIPHRITMTVPRLMLDVVVEEGLYFQVRINSYDIAPTTASQLGNVVTLAGGSYRFVDTASDAGRRIVWNNGVETTIITVTDATHAVVSNSQTVVGANFSAVSLPPGVVFEARTFNAPDWEPLYDSTIPADPPGSSGWQSDASMTFYIPVENAGTFHIVGLAGSEEVFSENFILFST